MDIDLIIFDCDGVLIDSELLANGSEVDFLKTLGVDISLDTYMQQFVGKGNADVLASLQRDYGQAIPNDFWQQVEAYTFEVFRERLTAIPGMPEVVDRVQGKKCVASNSSLERLDVSLNVTKLYQRFIPNIFSAEQVAKPKPAPDLFLLAAQIMDVASEACLVIEDSPHGVAAAGEAGMTAVGFMAGSHIKPGHDARLRAAGVVEVCASTASLTAWLSRHHLLVDVSAP
ncbi:MAG: HAD family phosphatase [Deinococcota bacterium]